MLLFPLFHNPTLALTKESFRRRRWNLGRHLKVPASVFMLFLPVLELTADDHIRQIDPYGSDPRLIPDIETQGTYDIGNNVIDIVILGDGYYSTEKEEFFQHAEEWYARIFGSTTSKGIRPFTFDLPSYEVDFDRAFRVRAVFKASTHRAGGPDEQDRKSYYKTKLVYDTEYNDWGIAGDGWWTSDEPNGIAFRDRFFDAIDDVSPLNLSLYPSDLSACPFYAMADKYSNLVVAFLVRKPNGDQAGGFAGEVPRTWGIPKPMVRCGFGECWHHEFCHAFAYVADEYIKHRGTASSHSNPAPSERSIYNLLNLSFSNDRSEDGYMLWPHLAPGDLYNFDERSLIGNLYKGGFGKENNVWHSEHQCLMNGTHKNYLCNVDPESANYNLRDHAHLCFWCEEIVTIRILEKTDYLRRAGDPADINERGRTWFQRWENSLRNAYYTYPDFDLLSKIAEKNACYDTYNGESCPGDFPSCENACDRAYVSEISCLRDCSIREVGNAMYVWSGAGAEQDGSREKPYDDIGSGINMSRSLCGYPYLVIIKPGSYPDPITMTLPTMLTAEGCNTVVLGD